MSLMFRFHYAESIPKIIDAYTLERSRGDRNEPSFLFLKILTQKPSVSPTLRFRDAKSIPKIISAYTVECSRKDRTKPFFSFLKLYKFLKILMQKL